MNPPVKSLMKVMRLITTVKLVVSIKETHFRYILFNYSYKHKKNLCEMIVYKNKLNFKIYINKYIQEKLFLILINTFKNVICLWQTKINSIYLKLFESWVFLYIYKTNVHINLLPNDIKFNLVQTIAIHVNIHFFIPKLLLVLAFKIDGTKFLM